MCKSNYINDDLASVLPKVKIFTVGFHTFIYCVDNKSLYATGYNEYGQLGFGDKNSRTKFEKVNLPFGATNDWSLNFFPGKMATFIGCSRYGRRSYFFTGQISYISGATQKSVSFQEFTDSISDALFRVTDGESFYTYLSGPKIAISAGAKYPFKRLGPFNDDYYLHDGIVAFPPSARIVGVHHAFKLFLDVKNNYCHSLMAMGNNDYGQLGLGLNEKQEKSAIVEIPCKWITSLVVGEYHSVILGKDGFLYGAGSNEFGQLGLGKETSNTNKFTHIPVDGKKVKKVFAGLDHTLCLCEDGTLYGTGRNDRGQLGTGDYNDCFRFIPVKTPDNQRVIDVATGFFRTYIRLWNGRIYAVGGNNFGQLGIGNSKNQNNFQEVKINGVNFKRIVKIPKQTNKPLKQRTFAEMFKPGDIIYGLTGARNLYGYQYSQLFQLEDTELAKGNICVTVIDSLNNRIINNLPGAVANFGKIEKNNRTKNFPPPFPNYLDFLINHKHVNKNISSRRIKQLCKVGIEFVTLKEKNKIHFILDHDKNKPGENKTLEYGRLLAHKGVYTSCTEGELRYLFRLRYHNNVMENVVFWLNNKQVLPPWETDPHLWGKYNPNSQQHPIFKIAECLHKKTCLPNKIISLKKQIFTCHYEHVKTVGYNNMMEGTFKKALTTFTETEVAKALETLDESLLIIFCAYLTSLDAVIKQIDNFTPPKQKQTHPMFKIAECLHQKQNLSPNLKLLKYRMFKFFSQSHKTNDCEKNVKNIFANLTREERIEVDAMLDNNSLSAFYRCLWSGKTPERLDTRKKWKEKEFHNFIRFKNRDPLNPNKNWKNQFTEHPIFKIAECLHKKPNLSGSLKILRYKICFCYYNIYLKNNDEALLEFNFLCSLLDCRRADIDRVEKILDKSLLPTFYYYLLPFKKYLNSAKMKISRYKYPGNHWQYRYYQQAKLECEIL